MLENGKRQEASAGWVVGSAVCDRRLASIATACNVSFIIVGYLHRTVCRPRPATNRILTNIHPWFRIIIQMNLRTYRRSIISKLSLVRHGTAFSAVPSLQGKLEEYCLQF
ncbi:hypothetical protein CBL_21317, partial [Carabus blaptoides fortunei]